MNDLITFLNHVAYNLRINSLKMTTKAGSGHPTSALSAADLISALFFYAMRFDPNNFYNPNNDRFILSKGHASPVVYAAWKELGILSEQDLMTYRSIDSVLEGHPTPRFSRWEAATGSLGQGLSVGVGMALSARLDALDFKTYVLLGDSECAEGSIWEACELAAYNKLANLIAILDVNRLGQSTQTMEGYDTQNFARKFEAFGWNTKIIDGHIMQEVVEAYDAARSNKGRPYVIIAKTVKGYGVEEAQNAIGYHGKVFKPDELQNIIKAMEHKFSKYIQKPMYAWQPQIPDYSETKKMPATIALSNPEYTSDGTVAPRKAFGQALAAIAKQSEAIVSLDAEVKNSTYAEIFEQQFPDRFIQCFVAEQNMVGMAVGLVNRNKIPFVSTFGAFFTRAYDQIRMAAIGCAPLRLVGSHCGVSIGQDGPSQMALEDIAMMRAVPNSVIVYPCDAVSTWKLVALMANHHTGISYLRLTRSETPLVYPNKAEFTIGGCSIIKQSAHDRVSIVTAGITLFEALKAYNHLHKENIAVAIIDLYSIKPLDASTLLAIARKANNTIITVEDHYLEGGLGEAVVSALKNTDVAIYNLAVTKLPRSGKPEELLAFEEINSVAIVAKVKEIIDSMVP